MKKNELKNHKEMDRMDFGYCILMGSIILVILICILCVKKTIGCSTWSFALLILSPFAGIITMIYTFRLIIGILKKHKVKIKIIALTLSLIAAYPLLILFGISNITYPNSGKEKPAISIQVPLKNKSNVVLLGGKEYKIHAIWGSECYAYDIMKKPYDIKSNNLYNFGIYGEEVISPIEGEVIAAYDDERDIPANQDEYLSLAGNYVYIRIEEIGTYLMFMHLKQSSVTVKAGDYVNVGDTIGNVGNSGTTSEPHLHLQHQRQNPLKVLHPTCAEGLPIIFVDNTVKTVN